MGRLEEPPDSSWDALEVPPTVACVICGRSTCDGCAPRASPGDEERRNCPLPWERSSPTLAALVDTALLTAEKPYLSFGRLGSFSGLGRAFLFAMVCEVLAISSFAGLATALLLWQAPRFTHNLFSDPRAWLILVSLIVSCALGMVALHAAGGDYLERGVRRAGGTRDVQLGMRFGFYACGWDLLTSPIGVVFCLVSRGRKFFAPLLSASRVPRRAMRAYLGQCRKMTEEAQTHALKHATWLALLTLLIGVLALFSGMAGYLLRILL